MKLISFCISGAFSAFRDPSVTSNQTSYYIPSKSSMVGILGAMVGISRPSGMDELYSDEYLDMYKNTRIGLRLDSIPKKVTFFTNHRSLKRGKKPNMKPFKADLVEKPIYTVYVKIDDDSCNERLSHALKTHSFVYSPYLGHAYCPATVTNFRAFDAPEIDPYDKKTRCVVLDESETYNPKFKLAPKIIDDDGSMIVERHLHHFFEEGGRFGRRVLKHWIPTYHTDIELEDRADWQLSEFYDIGDERVVCMY